MSAEDSADQTSESGSPPPRHAVILAAGYGSRLDPDPGYKILVEVDGVRLLDRHLRNFNRVGVREVTVVTGYEHRGLEAELDGWETPEGMRLHTAYNPDFDLGNGISVLAGMQAEATETPCWMTMSDHVFEPIIFDRLADEEPWREWERSDYGGVLAIDHKLDEIYDMPDANKVRFRDDPSGGGGSVEDVGKELDEFQAVDVGLFWCDQPFARALEAEREATGDCWTNDAVMRLDRRGAFGFWDIGDARWCDVDTPDDQSHAQDVARSFRE